MAAGRVPPVVVDIDRLEIIDHLQLDFTVLIPDRRNFNKLSPFMCATYYMGTELVIQINLRRTYNDMIEINLEVLAAPKENLMFKIKYGIDPFCQYQR